MAGSSTTVPHTEPVPLSGDLLERYRRDGFVLLPPEQLGASLLPAVLEQLSVIAAHDGPERVLERDGTTPRSVYGLHRLNPVVADVARSPGLVGAVRSVLDDDVYVYQSKVNFKAPLTGDQWGWHQDFVYWLNEDGLARPDLVNVALFLDEVTEFNGPLTFVPGSHRDGVLAGKQVEEMPAGYEEAPSWVSTLTADEAYQVYPETLERLVREHGMVSPKGPAGSVLLFHPNLMHASSANLSPFGRAVLLFVYNAATNVPGPVATPRPWFLAEPDRTPLTA